MTVKCIENHHQALGSKLRSFAFTQNEAGTVDLTVGSTYKVYGLRENKYGKFYLVLTDTIHHKLPWWMPATFFKEVDSSIPSTWTTQTLGVFKKDKIIAHPSYLEASEAIEDGSAKGYTAFRHMQEDKN